MTNFLAKIRPKKQKQQVRRYVVTACISIGALIVLVGILGALSFLPAKRTYQYALQAKESFLAAQTALESQDLDTALVSLDQAQDSFLRAQAAFRPLHPWRIVPVIGKQVVAIENVLQATIKTGTAVRELVVFANDIISPFTDDNQLQFSHLSRSDKRAILKSITEAQDRFSSVRSTIDEASTYVDAIPERGLIGPVRNAVDPLRVQFTDLKKTINQVADLAGVFPRIAGYPDERTYLFLLQNNTEMRPTGGFIGTYGILKMADGEILSFTTDNTYNLDSTAEEKLFITPPWPLTRYNAVKQWFLRDANWSADFPTSAQKAEELYRLEGGKNKIDGVIAVTPTFIESLLGLVGDITVQGITFTKDNFVEKLQYQVELGFLRQGIPFEERKDIMGPLSEELMNRIFDLPQSEWKKLWSVLAINLAEKHLLLYQEDPASQEKIVAQNWGGTLQETSGDFLMIVDANLASLKSDPAVNRSYQYHVDATTSPAHARLTITYENTGTLTWKTTRYRTYVRVFVPKGSQLTRSEGEMVDCKLPDKGSVEVTEENDKTVFGTFVCTEVGETRSLTFEYTLPQNVTNSDEYTLLAQKQPGTQGFQLDASFDFNKRITWVEPFDSSQKTGETAVTFSLPLRQDRHVVIRHK